MLGLLGVLLVGLSGCDTDIDPDSLVRELRVLGMRFGEATPGSEADVSARITFSGAGGAPDVTFDRPDMLLSVLAAAPGGPGRRLPAPRSLRYDWFVCLGELSLFSPGTLDPKCRKLGPTDPPARANASLLPLSAAPQSSASLRITGGQLKSILGVFLQVLLSGAGGGGGGMVTLPERPVVLLLPIIVEVTAADGDPANPLDREVAFAFLRVIVTLPGMAVPALNHNPTLPATGAIAAGTVEKLSDMDMPSRTPVLPCALDNPTGDASGGGAACTRLPATRTAPIFLVGHADSASIERYVPIDDSGRGELAEVMRYSWFSTDGTLSNERTGDSLPETRWENGDKRPAAAATQVVDVWLVVQDGRGGTDFQRIQMSLM